MTVTAVAGAQWGDEGKGKIVDLLAQKSEIVIRCQGGPNAGHTIVNSYGKFVLHGMPSGIFSPGVRNILAPGVVVNPGGLAGEIEALNKAGIDTSGLLISERAHLVLPYHRLLDQLQDSVRPADLSIGSTGEGIGPAYADKSARVGVRVGDLRHPAQLRERIGIALGAANAILQTRYGREGFTVEQVAGEIEPYIERLLPYIGDTAEPIHAAMADRKRILLEGQLGVMRDLDWGVSPFVTSSCPTPAGLAAGAGIPPQVIGRSIGVVKAYTTSVGDGPFPTEVTGAAGESLRAAGDEFGATTGRPRRCGWLDLPALAWACSIAGFTDLAVTKLDVLDGIDDIPVCTRYTQHGRRRSAYAASYDWADVEPNYEHRPGWMTPIGGVRRFDKLPVGAQAYVQSIESRTGCRVRTISVGPEREATILR